jgi:hypothetical protein
MAQPAKKSMFPPDKAEDKDYDTIAALSSIPSIGQAWAFPVVDSEFQELSVCLTSSTLRCTDKQN